MRISRPTPLPRILVIAVGTLATMLLGVPGAMAQSADDACADALLTVSPDSIDGEHTAVAITSQQMDADVDGWTQVSWAATEGTTLTGVTIHTADGTSTLSDDITTGTAQNALALTFCGTLAADGSGEDADEPDEGTAETASTCEGALVTVTPTSVEGDETAVAITSQQLDADVDGWTQVSWQAADGTTLTGVTVRTPAGTSTRTEGLASGTAANALELTFCGSGASDTDDEATTDDEIVEVPDPSTSPDDEGDEGDDADAGGDTDTRGGTNAEGDGDAGADSPDAGDDEGGEDDDSGGDAETGADTDEAEDGESDRTTGADDGDDSEGSTQAQADNDDADDDTEVLGVQLTQDEDEGSGWLLPILLIVAVGGAIGAGVLVRNRYLDDTGGR